MAQIGELSFSVFAILLLFAFIPPIVFAIWFRNSERSEREPWGTVIRAFVWGAGIGVIVAIVLSLILETVLFETGRFLRQYYVRLAELLEGQFDVALLVLVVFIAPVAEEFAKALGVFRVGRQINEIEDGLVYGAAAGLGFAATENVLYGAVAYLAELSSGATGSEALGSSLVLIGVRSFSSVLLHASSTAAFGYGIAKSRLATHPSSILPFYLLAVLMHGSYNFFASFGELFTDRYGDAAALLGFGAAVALAILAVGLARSAIGRRERVRTLQG